MIELNEAIKNARLYLESVFAAETPRNVRLEEIALSDDDKFWMVTFSFDRPMLGGTLWKKEYKLVKLDAESGQARAVQIRELV